LQSLQILVTHNAFILLVL